MGALFGFSGAPDSSLTTSMSQALQHRGNRAPVIESSEWGTLGVWNDSEAKSKHGGRPCKCNNARASIAISGWFSWRGRSIGQQEFLDLFFSDRESLLAELRGDFVVAIVGSESAFLIRDGAGQRSLYYSWNGEQLRFGSEPKAIWSAKDFAPRLRRESLIEYLAFSFVPQQQTMLHGLYDLLPGHVLECELKSGNQKLHRFFNFEQQRESVQSEVESDQESWPVQFRTEFEKAVACRLSDTENAVFLSGGLDSSVVAAEVAKQSKHPVDSFALHFGEQYPNELEFARAVASQTGTRHHEVLIEPHQFVGRLRQMIWHLDEPIGDPITMPNFELSSIVAKDYASAFNGEGGDPCFGGPKNIPMMLQHWYGGLARGEGFREQAYLASYRRGYEEIGRLLSPEFLEGIDVEAHLRSILRPFFEQPSECFLDKLCSINIRLKGAHLILPKVERMWGAANLTPCSPLFDSELIRFSFRMPSTMRLKAGVEKRVLKLAYQNDLPREVIDRPKSGMRVPVHYWFQGEMKRFAKSILRPKKLKRDGIWNPHRVKQLLAYNTEEGPGRYGIRLWMLITFELWREMLEERKPLDLSS